MSKIRITVPATTSNLGPGFDFLGIALNLYNVFEFEEIEGKDETIGFENVGVNLVLNCFKSLITEYSDRDIFVRIKVIKNEVPVARGLGSSATAIVSGCVAANYFMGNKLSESQLIQEMVAIEGHPDNILPCLKGGMISTVQSEEEFIYHKYDVNENLNFNVLIPNYKVKTEDARKALLKYYPIDDITFNASRAMLLPIALKNGDINLIKTLTDDRIHEPFRKRFIKEWDKIKEITKNTETKLNISGSGPTMLLISKNDLVLDKIREKGFDLEIHSLKVSSLGCIIEEM